MYINTGQQPEARKLDDELGALGSRYHDERANAMALNYQANCCKMKASSMMPPQ